MARLNRIACTALTVVGVCAAVGALAGDVARVKGADGVWTEMPLSGVREADGGVRYTFPAAEARKAQVVQFWLDCAQASAGEDGFWMGGRGVVGHFTRQKMRWANGAQFMDHPYFAMQTPRGAFIGIVEGMRFEFDAVVEAKNGRYRAYPSWNIERHAFGEVYEDLSLVVYELGKGADWNAMAKAYRRRVLAREGATRRIETLKERAKARPHLLKMANAIALRRRHACKPYVFKDPRHDVDFTPETEKKPECLHSFAQTLAFLQRLKALGVDDVAFCVAGWQDGGYDGRCPSSFPVSPEAGGEAELRKLISGGQALGYIVDGHSNYTDCYAVSPMWDGGRIACKFPDGSVQRCHDAFAGGRAYRLCLKNAWETFLPGELEKIAALGFRGAHYIDVFTAVYPYACCDPRHRANRKEIAAYQRQVVERCIALFGGFASECDMDHLVGLVDYVNYNTREIKNAQNARASGRDLPFDRIVPFSELAFHDYLLANPDKSTQEFPSGQNWLDLVEFGGRPIVYNFTDGDAERIRDLYLRFKPLRHLQLEEMVEHRDVAPGVVRVSYGDGSRVYVNHTDAPVEADGVSVPAMDYLLLRGASANDGAEAVVARRTAAEAARGAGKRGWIAWEAERNQFFPVQNLARVREIASFLAPTASPAGMPSRHRAEWDAYARTDEGRRSVAAAEKALAEPLVRVPPESFDQYRKTGDRGVYSGPKGKLEGNLGKLLIGEALENKGRFTGRIAECIMAICDEPSWVAPYEGGCADMSKPLDGDHYIDLTASRTAALVATSVGWFRESLPEDVRNRAMAVLRGRVFNTFLKDSRRRGGTAPYLNWWMPDRFNWSAVCHNGCVTAILAVEDDPMVRAEAIESAERLMAPNFLSGFKDDGWCEEGMGYWNFGFGNFMQLAGQVRAATDGRIDFCKSFPRAKLVAEFGLRGRMGERSSPPFADGNGAPDARLLALISQAWPALPVPDALKAASPLSGDCLSVGCRSFGKFKVTPPCGCGSAASFPMPPRDWFACAGALIARHKGLSFAIKGGSNGDRHNHDDAGSYVVNVGDMEVAGDPGGENYTGRTFSKRRYESKVLNSYGHPVPRVGGELQGSGPAFGAKVLGTRFTADRDTVVYDLADAYPAKVPIVKLVRTAVFDRKDGSVTVTDEAEFAEPTEFESPFIAWEKPKSGGGRDSYVLVRKGLKESVAVRISAEGGEWDVREEFIDNPGRTQPYRMAVAFRKPVKKGKISIRYSLAVPSAGRQLGILTPPESASPRINGPSVFGVRPSSPILYRVPVTGERPMKIEVAGLPEGATFDRATSMIGGAVAKRGDYPLVFAAENAHGRVERKFTLKVGDEICLTPPLGWNSWNCWGQGVTDEKMRRAADAMVSSGLADHGWSYIVVDDCWRTRPTDKEAGRKRPGWIREIARMYGPPRTEDGLPRTNSAFPDMAGMVAYIHSKGLKAGLYSVPGRVSCCWTWGSFGYEEIDAKTWAKWGVDLLKYDWCEADRDYGSIGDPRERQVKAYRLMGEILARQKRDIVYNVCNYGKYDVSKWARATGGHYWRTNDDLKDSWKLLLRSIDENLNVADAAGPGGWNDPDMLVVGPMRSNNFTSSRLTPNEQYAHMTLWAIMSAPLFIGCDLERIDPLARSLLTNDEVLEINQDVLGKVGRPVAHDATRDIWLRPLSDGSWAMAFFNRTDEEMEISADFASLGLPASCLVRCVWMQKDLGVFKGRFSASIPAHAALLFRLSGNEARQGSGVSNVEDTRPFGAGRAVLSPRIRRLQDRALDHDVMPAPKKVEYDQADEALPEPVRIGKRLKEYMTAQPVAIRDDEELVGWLLFDGSVESDIFRRVGHKAFDSLCRPRYYLKPQDRLATLEWLHSCGDFGKIVRVGFNGLRREVAASREKWAGNRERLDYLKGLDLALDGIEARAKNCVAECRRLAEAEKDAARKATLLEMAERLGHVPMNPARTFDEGVQTVMFSFDFLSDAIGRLDQYLAPLYFADLKAGRTTRERAAERLQELFICIHAHVPHAWSSYDKGGECHMTVGGLTPDGKDGWTDFSALVVDSCLSCNLIRPQMSFRWHRGTKRDVLRYMLDCERRDPNMRIAFQGDEPHIDAIVRNFGMPLEVARDYSLTGCNESTFPGGAITGGCNVNIARCIERIFTLHRADALACRTWEDFAALFDRELRHDLDEAADYAWMFNDLRAKDCNVLSALLLSGCIERATSPTRGGISRGWGLFLVNGLPNLIDSLTIVKQFVFDERRCTMLELADALAADWNGHEKLLAEIRRDGIFYGENDPRSNAMARLANETIARFARERPDYFGAPYTFGTLVGYYPHGAFFGEQTGPTPDGRHAGEHLSFGSGPASWRGTGSATSILLSAAHMDPAGFMCGGSILNLTVPPSVVTDDGDFEKLVVLVETYFREGGLHLQLNHVTPEMLIDAQKHPEKYANLRVRVSGFSGYFVKMRKEIQDEIIARLVASVR